MSVAGLQLTAARERVETPTIFVAEDDLATRALLRATLERAGYEVRDADNGASALAEITRCVASFQRRPSRPRARPAGPWTNDCRVPRANA